MGIELDVLVGHPEHELVFLGFQVATAAGLKDPARSLKQWRGTKEGQGSEFLTLKRLIDETSIKAPRVRHKPRPDKGLPGHHGDAH